MSQVIRCFHADRPPLEPAPLKVEEYLRISLQMLGVHMSCQAALLIEKAWAGMKQSCSDVANKVLQMATHQCCLSLLYDVSSPHACTKRLHHSCNHVIYIYISGSALCMCDNAQL